MSQPAKTTEFVAPPEVKPEVAKEEPKKEEPKSSFAEQFERISKQEKFVKAERQKIEEQRKLLQSEKEIADKYKGLQGKDPFEILEHFGVSYEKLLEADKARAQRIDPVARQALAKVEELQKNMIMKEQEAEKIRLAKLEQDLQHSIANEIRNGEYDLVEKLGMNHAVKEYMEEMFDLSGEIPSVKEACEYINMELANKILAVQGSKWLKPKEEPKPVVAEVAKVAKPDTLTNKMVQTSEVNKRPMTEKELLKAAVAVFEGH